MKCDKSIQIWIIFHNLAELTNNFYEKCEGNIRSMNKLKKFFSWKSLLVKSQILLPHRKVVHTLLIFLQNAYFPVLSVKLHIMKSLDIYRVQLYSRCLLVIYKYMHVLCPSLSFSLSNWNSFAFTMSLKLLQSWTMWIVNFSINLFQSNKTNSIKLKCL